MENPSFNAEKLTTPLERTFQCGIRLWRIQECFSQLPLTLYRKPDDLRFLNRPRCRFSCRRYDKVRESPSLNLSGALQECMNVAWKTRFKPSRGLGVSCHRSSDDTAIRRIIMQAAQ
jgi:hypothetical protein